MSFFESLLGRKNLKQHDGRPLWAYNLSNADFEVLKSKLKNSSPLTIDSRDVALYYSEWWKSKYKGGKLSKELVFSTLGDMIFYHSLDADRFYNIAKIGAKRLGIKWIQKQYTLYFRTLFLQGGLPLRNIKENHSNYERFLLAVIDVQPEKIEDFIFDTSITNLLPASCRNDLIYENCFEIVQSILKDDKRFDKLFQQNEDLQRISTKLQVRKQGLEKKTRDTKPQNYWVFNKPLCKIKLHINLAPTYTTESISNLIGFTPESKNLQLYLEDELFCVFRRQTNGDFKSEYTATKFPVWNGESTNPSVYILHGDSKIILKDFIQNIPSIAEPTLWTKLNDNEWRLVKGNGNSRKEAAVMFPVQWTSNQQSEEIEIINKSLEWLEFDGEIEIRKESEIRIFRSNLEIIDWTICSTAVDWLLKSNLPIVSGVPKILIYDKNGNRLQQNRFEIYYKYNNTIDFWRPLQENTDLRNGIVEIKITYGQFKGYDSFFNIKNLNLKYTETSIQKGCISVSNADGLLIKLKESENIRIEEGEKQFKLALIDYQNSIPKGISTNIKSTRDSKGLICEIEAPFHGICLTDSNGKIIPENSELSKQELLGTRILSNDKENTTISFKNVLKSDVVITKFLRNNTQPLVAFLDELKSVFYLEDAMNYKNKVKVELSHNFINKSYYIKGFSHYVKSKNTDLDVIELNNFENDLDLFAVPLNCNSEEINLIPLDKNGNGYQFPNSSVTSQFILISDEVNGLQLMPRFIDASEQIELISKNERIENYHDLYEQNNFDHECWSILLSYFNICNENNLPLSTFDEIRAISRSSEVAARAFFYLILNQYETEITLNKVIPNLEKDLGFCFHWINKEDWNDAFQTINEFTNFQYINEISKFLIQYFNEFDLGFLANYVLNKQIPNKTILWEDLRQLRQVLGPRVLEELPTNSPRISKNYNINITENINIRVLIQSPIAVGESIIKKDEENSIWGGNEKRETIRRNIQYAEYLSPNFYRKTIQHVLKHTSI